MLIDTSSVLTNVDCMQAEVHRQYISSSSILGNLQACRSARYLTHKHLDLDKHVSWSESFALLMMLHVSNRLYIV
jgi:hypothetical protein